jgi:hypothetical protein
MSMAARCSRRALDALDTALQPERVRDLGRLPARPGLGELTRERLIEVVVNVLPPPAAQDEHERRARAGGGDHLVLWAERPDPIRLEQRRLVRRKVQAAHGSRSRTKASEKVDARRREVTSSSRGSRI